MAFSVFSAARRTWLGIGAKSSRGPNACPWELSANAMKLRIQLPCGALRGTIAYVYVEIGYALLA